jgi:hypothetical protein
MVLARVRALYEFLDVYQLRLLTYTENQMPKPCSQGTVWNGNVHGLACGYASAVPASMHGQCIYL